MRGARAGRCGPLARPVPVLCLLLSVLVFLQSPGRTSFDTKLDLVVDPAGFLGRALRLWSPDVGFGGLQNQAYGYLFPQGPFFAAGQLLRADPWITQAAWASLLVVVAFLGALRLARALGIGTEATRLVAAAAYALAPRMLTVLGPISSEAGPVALAPWCVLPLVAAMHGRLTIRRGAALSGLAVLAMGGVNATADPRGAPAAGALPAHPVRPAAVAAGSRGGPPRSRWPACGGRCRCCCSAATACRSWTTSRARPTPPARRPRCRRCAARTTGSPPCWSRPGRSGRPDGRCWTTPRSIVATGAVAALGLAGLARRDLPERRFLAARGRAAAWCCSPSGTPAR